MSFKNKNLAVILVAFLVVSAEGFNLFEFLERKFSNVRPVYQPSPQQKIKTRVQQYRRPPAPRWPQLQYNYDRPIENNVIDEQPQPPPQQPAYVPAPPQPLPTEQQYRPQHQHTYKHYEPQYQQPPQPQQPQYQQPQHSDPYRPPHHDSFEPEQPADVPVVIGKVVHQGPPSGFISIESTTASPPTQAPYRYPEYDEVEIITAPPLGGHRHYGPTYEVQVGTNFNTRQ